MSSNVEEGSVKGEKSGNNREKDFNISGKFQEKVRKVCLCLSVYRHS